MKKIAIIGAGLTGLTLAQKLQKKFKVTVFEKSRGAGGRIATRRTDDFEFDHGAQYFTAKTESFNAFIQPLIQLGLISRWDARFVELNGNELLSARAWNESFPHYVGNPGMNVICKYLAKNLDVRFNIKIKLINPDNAWRLIDENNCDLGVYDWVIVTAPAEQTAQLLPATFTFLQTIQSIKMISCYSLMLGFEIQPELNFDAAIVREMDISWISVNSSKPGRPDKPSLLVHSTNLWAEANRDMGEQDIINYLCHELKKVTGLDANDAKSRSLHYWRYANIGKQSYHDGFIDYDNQLAACGDWCIQSRIESAFLIGHIVANKILARVKD